ncbi:ammonium transporter [Flavobacterium piscinae]|uniref:ammonium transporter n=1 Tax=Flavobacterium piscinae TaxID=2506424 RepID=UPI002AAA71A1|nr:ammonium transporter [Flavobacterium piscinae]
MLTWIFFDRLNGRKVSAMGACIGAVVGLVAITPAKRFCDYSSEYFLWFHCRYCFQQNAVLEKTQSIDDTLDVFACHGVGGIMGMILTAIFAQGENASLLHGGWGVFSHHMIALVLVAAFTFFGSMLLYKVTNVIIPLRVSEESEQIGLDLSQHDEQF